MVKVELTDLGLQFEISALDKKVVVNKVDYIEIYDNIEELRSMDGFEDIIRSIDPKELFRSRVEIGCARTKYSSFSTFNERYYGVEIRGSTSFEHKCGGYETTTWVYSRSKYQPKIRKLFEDFFIKEMFGEYSKYLKVEFYDFSHDFYVSLLNESFSIYAPIEVIKTRNIDTVKNRCETYFKSYSEKEYKKYKESKSIIFLEKLFNGDDVSEFIEPLKESIETIEKLENEIVSLNASIKQMKNDVIENEKLIKEEKKRLKGK